MSTKTHPTSAKRSASRPTGPGAAQYATKAILERRRATTRFVKYAESIAQDRNKALGVVRRAGVLKPSGQLTSHYKSVTHKK